MEEKTIWEKPRNTIFILLGGVISLIVFAVGILTLFEGLESGNYVSIAISLTLIAVSLGLGYFLVTLGYGSKVELAGRYLVVNRFLRRKKFDVDTVASIKAKSIYLGGEQGYACILYLQFKDKTSHKIGNIESGFNNQQKMLSRVRKKIEPLLKPISIGFVSETSEV